MTSATHTLSATGSEVFPGRLPNFSSWTAKNFSELGNLQLFGTPEISTKKLRSLPPLDPRVITITTRFVDWNVEPVSHVPKEWKRQLWSIITHRTALTENIPDPKQPTSALPIKGTGRLQEVRIEFEARVSQEQQLRDFAASIIVRELNKTVGSCALSISVCREGGMKPILTLDPNRVTVEKWNSPFKTFVMEGSSIVLRWVFGRYIVLTFVFTECCHCADCEPGSRDQMCKRRLKRATAAENAIVDITSRSWYAEHGEMEAKNGSEENCLDWTAEEFGGRQGQQ